MPKPSDDEAGPASPGTSRVCFLAVELPAAVARSIARWARPLLGRDARVVPPERYHLTLIYYGRVAEHALAPLTAAIDEQVHGARPLRLEPGAAGRFGKGTVAWVGIDGEVAPLGALRDRLVTATAAFGEASARAPRPDEFTPHVTVARARGRRMSTTQFLGAPTPWDTPEHFVADRLTLFESAGGDYRRLGEFPLGAVSA